MRPEIGGRSVCGTGRPIRADGITEGSPAPSRYRNKPANARNAISGSRIMKLRRVLAAVSVVAMLTMRLLQAAAGLQRWVAFRSFGMRDARSP